MAKLARRAPVAQLAEATRDKHSMTYGNVSDDDLRKAVAESISMAGVLRILGKRMAGGTHSHYANRIKLLGIDTSHFLGQGSNRGENRKGGFKKKHWTSVLIIDPACTDRRQDSKRLRRALLEYGTEYKCVHCGLGDTWNGKLITLEINHINEQWEDNRPENLEFLCPNCHSQTIGFGGRQERPERLL